MKHEASPLRSAARFLKSPVRAGIGEPRHGESLRKAAGGRRLVAASVLSAVLVGCVPRARPPRKLVREPQTPPREAVSFYVTAAPSEQPPSLTTIGHRRRVDLIWSGWEPDANSYRVLRGTSEDGPFECIADHYGLTVYSDFLGQDGIRRFYRIAAVHAPLSREATEEAETLSRIVRGESASEGPEGFLTGVQEAGIRYFVDYAHPVSGLAREWGREHPKPHVRRTCATGATGMGFMNLIIGIERGVLSREHASDQIRRMLRFLQDQGENYDGVFPHWLDGTSGRAIEFGEIPGGDVLETAFLMQGILSVREYFQGNAAADVEIRERADALWHAVRWNRFVDSTQRLYWHWPVTNPSDALRIEGSNEGHIAYLLAVASPTHPAPDRAYREGWVNTHRVVDKTFHRIKLEVGRPHGFPLFWTHYSYLGFDPRGIGDRRVRNYFLHCRNAALIHWYYAMENPRGFVGYSPTCWGLTASMGPDGYGAWTPAGNDNGTIAPTGALASMPYVHRQSLDMLEYLYEHRGPELWGAFGFYDAFNDTRNWISTGAWIGIDVGPIAPMIENYRTGLCWEVFMRAPEIQDAVDRLGLKTDAW